MKRKKESENSIDKVERYWMMLREDWKIVWKIDDYDQLIFVSCQGHIFIISWWLKSKLVTLDNFFKTNYLKSYDFWKNL